MRIEDPRFGRSEDHTVCSGSWGSTARVLDGRGSEQLVILGGRRGPGDGTPQSQDRNDAMDIRDLMDLARQRVTG